MTDINWRDEASRLYELVEGLRDSGRDGDFPALDRAEVDAQLQRFKMLRQAFPNHSHQIDLAPLVAEVMKVLSTNGGIEGFTLLALNVLRVLSNEAFHRESERPNAEMRAHNNSTSIVSIAGSLITMTSTLQNIEALLVNRRPTF